MQRLFTSVPPLLLGILVLATLLRIGGLWYGLPLFLVADEPAFPLSALKMLELRTLIPSLSPEAFAPILYYPPYLSYLYLPFFALTIGISYLFYSDVDVLFIPHLLADLTPFFLIARVWSVAAGVATVYLAYRLSQSLFASKRAALVTALLVATSLAHIALSSVARHWAPVTLVFLLVLCVLTYPGTVSYRRYGYALILIGAAAGISIVCLVFILPVALHFLLLSGLSLRRALTNRFLWVSTMVSACLAVLPSFLYAKSTGFVTDLTLSDEKSLFGLLLSPFSAGIFIFPAEPVLVLGTLAGLVLFWRSAPRVSLFLGLTISLYVMIFYVFFRFETRFFLPLIPLFALLGGYATRYLPASRIGAVVLGVVLLFPLSSAAALSVLAFTGDTRSLARNYMLETTTKDDRILVYANLTRVSTTRAAVDELRAIAPSALRKVDEAEAELDKRTLPHALNLYAISNDDFFTALATYAKEHKYQYLVFDPAYAMSNPIRMKAFSALTASSTIVASWKGMDPTTSFGGSSFEDPFWRLFSGANFGPDLVIYRLP